MVQNKANPQGLGGASGNAAIAKPPEKKGLPIKIIAIVVIVIAAGAFFFLKDKGSVSELSSGSSGNSKAYYAALPEIIVNMGMQKKSQKTLKLRIHLQAKSENDKLKIEEVSPQIIDQFQSYLRSIAINDLKGAEGLYRAKEELLMRANIVTNPTYVEDVLFQQLLIQ